MKLMSAKKEENKKMGSMNTIPDAMKARTFQTCVSILL